MYCSEHCCFFNRYSILMKIKKKAEELDGELNHRKVHVYVTIIYYHNDWDFCTEGNLHEGLFGLIKSLCVYM